MLKKLIRATQCSSCHSVVEFRRPVALMYFMTAKMKKSPTTPETLKYNESKTALLWADQFFEILSGLLMWYIRARYPVKNTVNFINIFGGGGSLIFANVA